MANPSENVPGADNQQGEVSIEQRDTIESTLGNMVNEMILRLERIHVTKSHSENLPELLRNLEAVNTALKKIEADLK